MDRLLLKFAFGLFFPILKRIARLSQFLTPRWINERWKQKAKLKEAKSFEKLQAEHAKSRLEHYDYCEDRFVNIKFVEEDRNILFKGHDIKWRYGRKSIDADNYSRHASHELCRSMFLEMSVYRWQFIESGLLWNNAMELFWRKILPKNYQKIPEKPQDYFTKLEKQAIEDFDSDRPLKISS